MTQSLMALFWWTNKEPKHDTESDGFVLMDQYDTESDGFVLMDQ